MLFDAIKNSKSVSKTSGNCRVMFLDLKFAQESENESDSSELARKVVAI